MTGRVMAKLSDVVMAPLQEWRRGGQTSKAQRQKNLEEHGIERGRRQKEWSETSLGLGRRRCYLSFVNKRPPMWSTWAKEGMKRCWRSDVSKQRGGKRALYVLARRAIAAHVHRNLRWKPLGSSGNERHLLGQVNRSDWTRGAVSVVWCAFEASGVTNELMSGCLRLIASLQKLYAHWLQGKARGQFDNYREYETTLWQMTFEKGLFCANPERKFQNMFPIKWGSFYAVFKRSFAKLTSVSLEKFYLLECEILRENHWRLKRKPDSTIGYLPVHNAD